MSISKNAHGCKSTDCGLIMEAIRRLREGTWLLLDEDRDYTWELLPNVKEAIEEHIRFEEEIIFPSLTPDERASHRLDHSHLTRLMRRTQKALEKSDAEEFQKALHFLVLRLNLHHHDFDSLTAGLRTKPEPIEQRFGSAI